MEDKTFISRISELLPNANRSDIIGSDSHSDSNNGNDTNLKEVVSTSQENAFSKTDINNIIESCKVSENQMEEIDTCLVILAHY